MLYGFPSHSFLSSLNTIPKLRLTWTKWLLNQAGTFGTFVYGNEHSEIVKSIQQQTIVSRNHLTPEIRLNLITPDCKLWKTNNSESPFDDPFWAFYWPGGQALSRFVLDNPEFVANKNVVDIGCGSGACSIAAALSGASKITANDIDLVACVATFLNAGLNHVKLDMDCSDLIGEHIPWDCILIGDMLYDGEFSYHLFKWLSYANSFGKSILIGDANRISLIADNQKHLRLLRTYSMPDNVKFENDGLSTANVWSF